MPSSSLLDLQCQKNETNLLADVAHIINALNEVDGPYPTASMCQNGGCHKPLGIRSRPMTEVITIGLDLAKNVFQIHGVDGLGDLP